MRVIRAKTAGFCFGVRRAVERAESAARTAGGAPVFTDGPLIHNRHEVERLAALGVRALPEGEGAVPAGATVVVRAHGVPPERMSALEASGARIVDGTCPHVLGIQRTVREAASAGRAVWILGDEGHAEVVGLLGHAGGAGTVVSGPEDAGSRPDPGHPVTLVAQSTQPEALFRATADAVLARFPDAEIRETICGATRARQGELESLSERCDAIVVVGSPASANTGRLAQLAACLKPTFVADGPGDLDPARFAGFSCVGLTAGASTPDSVVAAVEARLAGFPPAAVPATPEG